MIKLLKKIVSLILSPLIALIDFPVVPDGLAEYTDKFIEYLHSGMGFISFFLPMTLVNALLTFVVACELFMLGYRIVMWILQKIPMLGIK